MTSQKEQCSYCSGTGVFTYYDFITGVFDNGRPCPHCQGEAQKDTSSWDQILKASKALDDAWEKNRT